MLLRGQKDILTTFFQSAGIFVTSVCPFSAKIVENDSIAKRRDVIHEPSQGRIEGKLIANFPKENV